jgi:hypothetical protein
MTNKKKEKKKEVEEKKEVKNEKLQKKEVEEIAKEVEKAEKEIEKEIEEESQKLVSNIWFIGIIALTVGLLVGAVLGMSFSGDKGVNKHSKDDVAKVAENTIKYFYSSLLASQGLQMDIDVKAKDVKDSGSFYNVTLEVNVAGQKKDFQVYVSRDLKYVTPIILPAKKELKNEELSKGPEVQNKTKKPKVILAVMSNCPFGNQVEPVFKEIIDTFGDKINFEPRYIIYKGQNPYGLSDVTINGTHYWSLHGKYELEQDLFELTVYKLYGAKVWAEFVNKANEECLTKYSGDDNIEKLLECDKKVAKEMGLDVNKIEEYLNKNKDKLILEQVKLTNDQGIMGSPTIIVNGEQYRGARTVNALKNYICSAFENAPEECNKTLKEVNTSNVGSAKCGN